MKRNLRLIILPLAALLLPGCNRNTTEIAGLIEGGEDRSYALERLDVNRTTVIDSIHTDRNGAFAIKIDPEEPALYILKNREGKIINLLLSPGHQIMLRTTWQNFGTGYVVEGSEESEKIHQLVKQMNRTRNDLDSLLSLADAIDDPEDPKMDLIKNTYAQTIIRQKRYTIRFIVENLSSLSSIYALYQKYDPQNLVLGEPSDLQYFKSVADSLEVHYPDIALVQSLRADIQRKENEINTAYKVEKLLEQADEEITGLLDLKIPDRNGDSITLSSLQGKVILVYFWASENPNSVESLLSVRSTYKKYHEGGFEIYAISLDNDRREWIQSIEYNEFDWVNVSELTYPDSRANLFYNVTSLPSNFLINREGDIIAKNLYGKTLETWLDNLI